MQNVECKMPRSGQHCALCIMHFASSIAHVGVRLPSIPTFKRRPPPVPVQWARGLFMYGLMTPVRWTLEKLGYAERMLKAVGGRRERDFSKKNPFRGYIPGEQDVFVMTYAKSGTNWAMQIAHQLIYHGKGEFDHLHDVVP